MPRPACLASAKSGQQVSHNAYAPEAFAVLMLRVRDRLLSAPAGDFAQFAAEPGDPPARHGWRNYDQLQATLTFWETSLFAALRFLLE